MTSLHYLVSTVIFQSSQQQWVGLVMAGTLVGVVVEHIPGVSSLVVAVLLVIWAEVETSFLGLKVVVVVGVVGNVGRACFPRSKFLVMSVLCGDSLLFSNWVTFGVMFLWCRKLCGGGGTLFPKCSLVVAGFGGAAYPVSNIVLDVVIFMCGGLTSDCGSFFFGVSVVLVYLGVSSC